MSRIWPSRTRASSIFVLGALALLVGCPELDIVSSPLDASADDSNRENMEHKDTRSERRLTALDLLFVIDNSQSMAGAQAALRAQLPRFLHRLTSGERL